MSAASIQDGSPERPLASYLPSPRQTAKDPEVCATDSDNIAPRQQKSKQSLDYILRSGLAGGLAGCAAKTLIAPLDRVKILFQTSAPIFQKYSGTSFGFFLAASKIYTDDGVVGLFRGHSMTLVRIFPYAAIKFVAYEQFRHVLIKSNEEEVAWRRLASGSLAGVTSVFFTYPLELVRVRLAFETRREYKTNVGEIFGKIYREHLSSSSTAAASPAATASVQQSRGVFSGLANFYRGFSPTILGMLPYAGTSFLAHDLMGDWFRSARLAPYAVKPQSSQPAAVTTTNSDERYSRSTRPQLKIWAQLTAGGIAGLASQTASYPLEVIRRRMQVGGAVGTGKFMGIRETAALIFRERGLRGFYVGLTIGYVKVVPMVATSFFVYERTKGWLGI